jgi:hypothetical protein
MIVGLRLEAELPEDARDVGLDGLLGDEQALGDAQVGAPFGHQRQHLALARRQRVESIARSRPADERRDDGRVDDGPACRDPSDGVHKLVDIGHPILEEVADRAGAVAEESDGVSGVSRLGQHEDADD